MKFRATSVLILFLLFSFLPLANASITLEPFLSGLDQPVFVGNAHDGSNRLFIVEQPGRIRVLQPGETLPTTLLNITSRVLCCGEQGLLGLAFHPQFASNRRFFVNYTRVGDGATVIAEYAVTQASPNAADTTERVILTIPQPFVNHNGGMLAFGPDGYLYIGMGDGGSGNDPNNYSQNVNELLGKILRIDVDQIPYASPPSNPFFGATPGRDEIYAIGLRNPWRFSFDRVTNQLYVGDVGQDEREEVDLVTAGGNYGWRVFEGTRCTNIDSSLCTTAGGTSEAVSFTVANPFPDLEIVGAHNGPFAAGFDETYTITVRNLGGMPTTAAITVTDSLPDGLTFVSVAGAGWSCSAAGSNLSCINPSVLAPNATTGFALTVAVDTSAAPGVTHTVSVSTAGDLSLSNNTHSENTPVLAVPTPTFVFTPSSLTAGQQASLALTVDPPFPHKITGTLRLKFSPDPAVGVEDPAIQFETGGRDVTFEVQANASEARFTGAPQATVLRFQTGTVAGSLRFDGTLKAGRLDSTFSSTGLSTLTIPSQPPAIQSVQPSSTGGFAVLITSFSTGRTITQLTLDFQTAVPVRLSCGTTPGCSTSGSKINLNVASLFADWFAGNAMFGSGSTLRLPLSINGVVPGTVSVTLRNERGASNSLSFPLP